MYLVKWFTSLFLIVFCFLTTAHSVFADGSHIATQMLCNQTGETGSEFYSECLTCQAENGIWTAIGCIPTTPERILLGGIKLGIGLAGGFALLFLIFGSLTVSVSTGDPQKLQNGQQMITSAIVGVFLIVFSVVILNIIGVQILAIPEF